MTTVYRSDDLGAPTLTRELNSFSDLLQAVLVDGYGSKVGAGWTTIYTDVGKKVFYNGSAYYRIDDSISFNSTHYGTAIFRAYDIMSDIDTGSGMFISRYFWYTYPETSTSTSAYQWMILADSKTVYIFINYRNRANWFSSTTQYSATAGSNTSPNSLFFGEQNSFLNSDGYKNFASIPHATTASWTSSTFTGYFGYTSSSNYFMHLQRGADRTTIGKRVYSFLNEYSNVMFGPAGFSGLLNNAISLSLSADYTTDLHSQYYYSPVLIKEFISGDEFVIRGKLPGIYLGPYVNRSLQGTSMDYTGKQITAGSLNLMGISIGSGYGLWISTDVW